MPVNRRSLILPLLVAALAGCGGSTKDGKAEAGGEVLPGSASDAMLPLDTVTSQPPLAPQDATTGAAKASGQQRRRQIDTGPGPAPYGHPHAADAPVAAPDASPAASPSADEPQ